MAGLISIFSKTEKDKFFDQSDFKSRFTSGLILVYVSLLSIVAFFSHQFGVEGKSNLLDWSLVGLIALIYLLSLSKRYIISIWALAVVITFSCFFLAIRDYPIRHPLVPLMYLPVTIVFFAIVLNLRHMLVLFCLTLVCFTFFYNWVEPGLDVYIAAAASQYFLISAFTMITSRIIERYQVQRMDFEKLRREKWTRMVEEEKRLIKMELRESQELLGSIFDYIKDGVVVIDSKSRILLFNSAAEKIIGEKLHEFTQENFTEKFERLQLDATTPIPDEEFPVWHALNGEVPKQLDFYLRRRGEKQGIYIRLSARPLMSENNEVKAVLGVFQDISSQIEREEGLMAAKLELEHLVKARTTQLRSLSSKFLSYQEEERKRLSREVHDELGQALLAIKLHLYSVDKAARKGSDSLSSEIEETMKIVDKAIEELRRISMELRPSILDDLGLKPALEWLLQTFEEMHNIKTQLEFDFDGETLPEELTVTIFRVIQEAATNVARHSEASKLTVRSFLKDSFFCVSIEDNGIGIKEHELKKPRSFGIKGMEERVRMIGGDFEISSNEGQGCCIELNFPIEKSC